MRLFSGTQGHKKPNPKQNCFQNYMDHLNYKEEHAHRLWKEVNGDNWFRVLGSELLDRANWFSPLRDGHDFADDVLGAFVGVTAYNYATMGFLALSVWEAACGLAMTVGLVKDDGKDHGGNALKALAFAAAAYVMSISVFMISVLSLIIRPLVTAVVSNKPQNVDRFFDNERRAGEAQTSFATASM